MDERFLQPEDFAGDESFVSYCLSNDKQAFEQWEQWLADHPEQMEMFNKGRELVFALALSLTPEEKELEWINLEDQLRLSGSHVPPKASKYGMIRRSFTWMGSLLVLFALGFALYSVSRSSGKEPKGSTAVREHLTSRSYIAKAGERRFLVLPDGTRVWLNSESKLTLGKGYNGSGARTVSLVGEAFFEVRHSQRRPFVIHTSRIDIRDLGTSFNVRDYPGDKSEEAALIRGSIEVSFHSDSSRRIVLKPDEKITVTHEEFRLTTLSGLHIKDTGEHLMDAFSVAPLRTDPLLDSGVVETAWLEGKLVFREETFEQLARQMERKYGVKFHFGDSRFKNYRFTGIFSTESVRQALEALRLTSPADPFNFSLEGHDVYIMHKSS